MPEEFNITMSPARHGEGCYTVLYESSRQATTSFHCTSKAQANTIALLLAVIADKAKVINCDWVMRTAAHNPARLSIYLNRFMNAYGDLPR